MCQPRGQREEKDDEMTDSEVSGEKSTPYFGELSKDVSLNFFPQN